MSHDLKQELRAARSCWGFVNKSNEPLNSRDVRNMKGTISHMLSALDAVESELENIRSGSK